MSKKRTDPLRGSELPDEAARRAIRDDLSTTILVEAAAGTGKTDSLVRRMVALVSTGATTLDRLSAVTFTIRAAAQLKQRFQNALEKALAAEKAADAKQRLSEALRRLDSCFVGTIHAFGARLLRERPVESGLEPGFRELDEAEDGAARGEAWDRFCEELFLAGDPRLARLIELDIRLPDLQDSFDDVCENSDVTIDPGARLPEPSFARARGQVEAFLARAEASVPAEAPPGGWSGFERSVRRARRLLDLASPDRPADFVAVLRVLKTAEAKKGVPGALKKVFDELRDHCVKPALTEWAEYVYPDVCELLVQARDQYREWRRREGLANFQDLLLYARDLLRDHPEVRASLARRFTPVLVDEFQDTDPIQAEILFFLTGTETEEKDWKKLVPQPGSLFVVGDPKQSIYRFRRADIQTYNAVRSRIEACGRLLFLTTNFRSAPPLSAWVNRVFSRTGFFPKEGTEEQAAYVPLEWESREEPGAPPVLRIDTPAPRGGEELAARTEAARIADFIASEVAGGSRRPEDFLLLFRRRKFIPEYARALEGRGLPCVLSGGEAFGTSAELAALMPALEALADPENPVPLLAALRGPLFGVDDEALYRFSRAGGRFSYRYPEPAGTDPRLSRALALFREGEDLAASLPPGGAIARFVGKLGWVAAAASRDLADTRAGNLLKAIAAVRKFSAEGRDFARAVEELSRLRLERTIEEMGVEPRRPGAIRLMTLHSAKGLEAPVVFLAEPLGGDLPGRSYFIDRSADPPAGFFRVARRPEGFGGDIEIARPFGWDAMERTEERFDEAEKTRLLYVGSTRAEEMFVASFKMMAGGRAGGPWEALSLSIDKALPQVPAPPRPSATLPTRLAEDLDAARRARAEKRATSSAAGYSVASVTALAHAGQDRPFRESTGRGFSWGSAVHRLLEAAMRDAGLDLRALAANVLAEEGRDPSDLDEACRTVEAVRASPLWKRALAAKTRMVEVPFALTVASAELGGKDGPSETLLTGALDLVFEEEDGWKILDYKSDTVAGNLEELVAFYRPQVDHYRRYWQKLTGRPTKAGLYFVGTGQEVWLDETVDSAPSRSS
ncbi:MAG TPA: UvrD-helicase domain-containing protein [Thermoanaerobaculia bacterium]|nr:UvrD-helicase domain-containing protein [Thermoanaerobaculia bacterium]